MSTFVHQAGFPTHRFHKTKPFNYKQRQFSLQNKKQTVFLTLMVRLSNVFVTDIDRCVKGICPFSSP